MNIGVFGVGSFGEKHINVLQNIDYFNIIGFFDPNQKRSLEIEKKFSIKSYTDPEILIKKCDAIDIVSETSTHCELIEFGIQHNKHIFIEKPICSKKEEIKKILKATKKYKPIIQVGHIERYNPAMDLKFENLEHITNIETKRTGQLNERNKDTSITLDLMIHDIDLVLNMTQTEILNIKSTGSHKNNGLYDEVQCILKFKNGTTAKLVSKRGSNIKTERKMIIHCTNQTIEIDLFKKIRKIITHNKEQVIKNTRNTNPLREELIGFYKNIKNKKNPEAGITEACLAVNTALTIDECTN